MFEGWLFILVRRPYDIGDRIHISNPQSDTSINGSASWFVRDVDLFTTTVVFAATGEKATLSNGSLAASRVSDQRHSKSSLQCSSFVWAINSRYHSSLRLSQIINMARSPNGVMFVFLRFMVDTPRSKIEIFEEAVRKFVKSRPRDWAQLLGFRPSNIAQEQGYVEYMIILQHRESWQNVGAMLVSKAEVSSFCLELSKTLDMRYKQPPMPVDLSINNRDGHSESDSVVAKFQQIAATAGDDVAAMFSRKSS